MAHDAFRLMRRLIAARCAQLNTSRLEMTEYKRAARHIAGQDVAGKLDGKTSDQISREYLATLAPQEWLNE